MIKVEVKTHKKGFALYLGGVFLGVSSTKTAAERIGDILTDTMTDQYDEGYTQGHYEGYGDAEADAEMGLL